MSDNRDPLMQFFVYGHLKPVQAATSAPFGDLADWVVENLPRNAERTVCLRKLLEAKDCAVRATLFDEQHAPAKARDGE
jgi:hypothetical protein